MRTKSFDGMASDGWGVSTFEKPHNLVHTQVACNGTLSDVNWAAFNPLLYATCSRLRNLPTD
jgi:hypothetical protein